MAISLEKKKEIYRAAFARTRNTIPKMISPMGGSDTWIIWKEVQKQINELCLKHRLNNVETEDMTNLVNIFFKKILEDKLIISFEADREPLHSRGVFGPGYYSHRFD